MISPSPHSISKNNQGTKMRHASKFSLRKLGRKKDKLLLSESQGRDTSDFISGVDRDETRNDEGSDPWLTMPYQVPTETTNVVKDSTQRQVADVPIPKAFPDKSTDKVEQKYHNNGTDTTRARATMSKNHKRVRTKQDDAFMQFTTNPSAADVFEDLDSVKEEIILSNDSLEDIMDETETNFQKEMPRSISNRKSVKSFKIDANSSESSHLKRSKSECEMDSSSESSSSADHLIDPRYSKKRGILIVDPQNNGEVYRMDEENKCLTDKELIIIGGNRDGEDGDDDETMMSNLTEVTYQRSKEERMKYLMKNLKDAASQIPESTAWCGIFECSASNNIDKEDINGASNTIEEEQDKNSSSKGSGDPSMTQNAKLLFNSLFNKGGEKVDVGSFSEKIVVCITRIYLSLQEGDKDNGLRCTYNEPKLCHDLGVRLKEASDGQAVVVDVLSESTAARSGVQVGDVLSFAVPLNNTFQGYEKACDFISRLELIGMRTSYRTIFDMFLSKTSSGWPVATVFKRHSRAMKNFEHLPLGVLSVDLNIDLSRAASFFHEIVTRSREYDYGRESNGVYEVVRGNIEAFIPKPQCRISRKRTTTQHVDEVGDAAKTFGLDTSKGARTVFLPKISDENLHQPMFFPDARRSSLLTWYTENSDSIIYLKFNGTFGGSGVGVFRINGGLWSAPCAIRANISGVGFRPTSNPIECMIFVRDLSDMDGFRKGNEITVGGKDQKERICVVSKIADRFCIENNIICSCVPRNDINTLLYSKYHSKTSTELIINGKLPSPSEAATFCGALRRLELPSTMYPHPTPPNNLIKFNLKDWTKNDSCKTSGPLESPFDESTVSTLKDLLNTLENGESIYTDELNEFEVFTQKFNQMLYDGVTIDRAWPTENGRSNVDEPFTSKVTLKLDSRATHLGKEHFLLFITKSQTNKTGILRDYTKPTDLSKNKHLSESLKLHSIVKVSQTMPKSFSKPQTSPQEKKKHRKRFVSLKTNDGKTFLFLARTGKDASLLACGLKLIVERSQGRSQFQ